VDAAESYEGAGPMRILLVEDEKAFADDLARGLGQDGFAVDVARTGTEGLWSATQEEYDAILLDIMLPGCSGYEVVRRLRAADVWSPVLMLTAKDGEHDIADALDLGADDYLVKPFSYVVLLARLRALLRRGTPERPVQLTAGDLTIDPAARRCWRGVIEVVLTTREFAVLHHLAGHLGDICSKTQVLGHVWDEHFEGDLNIVEVYIGYLRRKIDVPFGRTSIETIRGAGYRLRSDGGVPAVER
jgi:DNA-binding response OmpR family regulator